MDRNWIFKTATKYFNTSLVILCFSLAGCGGGSGSPSAKEELPANKNQSASSIPALASPVAVSSSNPTPAKLPPVLADDTPSLSADIIKAAYDLLFAISTEVDVIHSAKSPGNYSGPVTFKDPTLDNAVHAALGFPSSSTITTDNLKNLTDLQVIGPVTTLDGLQYATNLTEFRMYVNNGPVSTFTSIEPLASLTRLKKLLLITGLITNIDALKGLPLENVEFFELDQLTDISGLADNSTLKHLAIVKTPVSNIDPLKSVQFVSGADVLFSWTCSTFFKDTSSLATANVLKQKGVVVSYDVYKFDKIGTVNCPVESLNVDPDPIVPNSNFLVTAKYNSTGTLKVSWSTNDILYVGQVNSCDIYAELDYQLPRVPLKTISNCPATSSVEISDMPYVGSNITVRIKSVAIPQNSLKAKASIDDSLIATNAPVIRALDWGQSVIGSNPKLIQNREALFRVHVTANSPTPVPEIFVVFSLNGQTKTVTLNKPASLPTTKNYSNLMSSYNTIVPAEWMKPGLSLSVNLNSTVKIITPNFADPAVLYLTLVPTKLLGLDVEIPNILEIQNDLKSAWPLSDVKVRTRAGFASRVTQAADLNQLLNELRDLHTIDQDNSFYYGYFSHNTLDAPFGGLGDKPGRNAIGMDTDNSNIMPHEIGHNFDLGHTDCGNPLGVDSAYPYDPNTMGSFAIDLGLKVLYSPSEYKDLMSYCYPKHTSDYSFNTAQDYIIRTPLKPFSNNDSTLFQKTMNDEATSLFISGEIDGENKVNIRRIVPLTAIPKKIVAGDYQLKIGAQDGTEYFYGVELPKVDHPSSKQTQYFSAVIPYVDLVSVTLLHHDKVIYSESIQQSFSAVKKKLTFPPVVEETSTEVCVRWVANGTTATLIHQGERSTTLFMDAENGYFCASNIGLDMGGAWKIILRKGISVERFSQVR